MLKEVNCNLCGKNHYEVLYKPENTVGKPQKYLITESDTKFPGRIVRCLGCGLVYVNPREDDPKINACYEDMVDKDYEAEAQGRRISANIILKRLKRIKRKGRILDLGCATGFLLDEAKKQGWEPYGVELSRWCVDYANRKFGLNIFCGHLKDAKFQQSFFDAVILNDTIEHLPDPKATLIEIRRLLKPNGVLCVSTPNIDSLVSRALKARWWGINQSHIFYFTKKTLYKMLNGAGFTPFKRRSHPRSFSLKYWVFRLKNYKTPVYRVLKFLSERSFIKDRIITIDTADQMEVYAKKSRKLEYLDELEWKRGAPAENRKLKVTVVLPAYNAAKTLKKTVDDIPKDLVDEIILVDDKSTDNTVSVARSLGLKVFSHDKNLGYGGNQKTCYKRALEGGADIVIMVHPDYQYDPKAIPSLVEPIKRGEADAVFGSRMMKGGALIGGMPLWKHNTNIILTAVENVVFGTYLTEYHSGFRAYSAKALNTIHFMDNSDGFIFDTEIIAQLLIHYFNIEEVPIKTRYFEEASKIKFIPSLIYGFGILKTLLKYILHTRNLIRFKQFE